MRNKNHVLKDLRWLTIVWYIKWANAANVCNEDLEHLRAAGTKCTHRQIQIQVLDGIVQTQADQYKATQKTVNGNVLNATVVVVQT